MLIIHLPLTTEVIATYSDHLAAHGSSARLLLLLLKTGLLG
jgi:hypothetical protein